MIRVVVAGVLGKTGREVAKALYSDPDVALVGGVDVREVGNDVGKLLFGEDIGVTVEGDIERALDGLGPDVLVDFTRADAAHRNVMAAVERGVRPVVGTTGFSDEQYERMDEACRAKKLGAVFIPNFSIGMMLMSRWAEEAARFFPDCELIELHHNTKLDSPSGTAKRLAGKLASLIGRQIPVHSIRLPGLVAHHELVFGAKGELMTIRHDSMSRESFAPGVLHAVKSVMQLSGPVYDLEELYVSVGALAAAKADAPQCDSPHIMAAEEAKRWRGTRGGCRDGKGSTGDERRGPRGG